MAHRLSLHVREERRRCYLQSKTRQAHPMCLRCGHDDPFDLIVDHVSGRAYGPEVRLLCTRCHSRRNAEQYDHPTCPPHADARTREEVWAWRYILSWLEMIEAARPVLDHAFALLGHASTGPRLPLLRADRERKDAS